MTVIRPGEGILPGESLAPDYIAAQHRDPLRLDGMLARLPDLNKAGDINTIVGALVTVHESATYATADVPSALAALRDVDFLAGSVVRHGVDPIKEVRGLGSTLLDLGRMARTVPRGTVATYAIANPEGGRRRTFTGTPEEHIFIDSVRSSALALERALEEVAAGVDVDSIMGLSGAVEIMVNDVIEVKRKLSPEFFANVLRPYFEPLVIEGKPYLGAGGAQLQLVAVDYVLWGCETDDSMYTGYFEENRSYLTADQRGYLREIRDANGGRGLITQAIESHDIQLGDALLGLLRGLRRFRYPHRRLARDNLAVRGEGAVGSGSYTTDILDYLIKRTDGEIDRLSKAFPTGRASSTRYLG